jgi:hypothetical protein
MLENGIRDNLKQLVLGATQYFLENGKSEVAAKEIIGPNKFVKELKPLDREDYVSLNIKQGEPVRIRTRSGLEVEITSP